MIVVKPAIGWIPQHAHVNVPAMHVPTISPGLTRVPSTDGGGAQQAFVTLTDVSKFYPIARGGLVRAVDGVNLTIERGQSLGLVGESGCGKSTIARLLVGLETADRGTVSIDGQSRSGLSSAALKAMRRRVQIVFQDPFAALDPRMRLGDSLDAPLAAHQLGEARSRRDKAVAMLEAVGLDASFLGRLPQACSGGQLQRVVIARALLLEPEVLVCDEPTSALDASVRAQILNLLVGLRQRLGLTLLVISHDLRVVRFMCDRVAVMYLGQIVETAPRDGLFDTARHPYTQALVAASMIETTGIYHPAGQLVGEPPSPSSPPVGCRFHPRCSVAEASCGTQVPSLEAAGDDRHVRCHRWCALATD